VAEYAANSAVGTPQKEYGYRNGQLLVTATATTGWGAPPVLNDNPLVLAQTTVQARHITELRDAINALRSHLSLSAYSWQYSVTTNDWITASPILEMRTALDQALGAPSGGYAAGLAQGQPIKAIHIQELRDRVLGAWISGTSTDIRWLVPDHLGTPRIILDQTGSFANLRRHDYLPFGEELSADTGGRTPAMGYVGGDGVRQQFTQEERDVETGLDYFGARYFGSVQGRFTSVDPFSIILLRQASPQNEKAFLQFIGDPRRWNRYGYAVNSPLVFTDKTGLDIMIIENGPTDGNPFGHTAIAITGRGLWSFGNADHNRAGERSTEFNDIWRGDVKDYVLRELPRRDTRIYIIKTTAAQDEAAAAVLDAIATSGQTLTREGILSDNCSVRVNKALDAAGIEKPPISPAIPGSAALRITKDPATSDITRVIEVPQNSNLTQSDRDAIKPFESTKIRPNNPIPKPGTPGGTPVVRMRAQTRP
jgi:RHS repeat-associated protein